MPSEQTTTSQNAPPDSASAHELPGDGTVLLLPVGLGVVLAPKSLLAVRRQADLQRRWAREWSGVTIAAPYRPLSAKPTNRLFLVFRRCRWVLGDPATWRDLLWTLVNVPVSVVLGLLPAFLLGAGAWTVGCDRWSLLEGWTNAAPHGFLLQVLFLSMLPACVIAGPWLLRMHATAASSLLAPTRKEMAAKVGRRLCYLPRRQRHGSRSRVATAGPP